MKGKNAFEAMEGIDHKYILEAAPDAPVRVVRKTRYLRIAAVAAALAVVVAVGAVMVPMMIKEPEIPTGDDTPNISVENVFSVAQTHYGATSLIPDEDADVSLNNVVSQDENRPDKNSFVFKGTEYDLAYRDSVYYPKADYSVHAFKIVGAEKAHLQGDDKSPRVEFFDDGSLAGIYNMELGRIDLDHDDSDKYVISEAEKIASQYTNLDRYTQVRRIRYTPESRSGVVIWYNDVGGKRLPGMTMIAITEEGLAWIVGVGIDYKYTITEKQLPTNEMITEIVKTKITDENLCNMGTVRNFRIEYDIIVFRGEVYAHTSISFQYTEELADGGEQDRYGSLEYLIPITEASVSHEKLEK